ncbi:MAG: protein kinase [Nanoarchaeota archaeon]|nr:protein kinase [Nanoarchaeota archaeon]
MSLEEIISNLEIFIKSSGRSIKHFKEEEYDERFNREDKDWLIEFYVSPKMAAKYHSRFNGRDISTLVFKNVKARKANLYDKKFDAKQISILVEYKCTPEKADEYNKRFTGEDISWLGLYKVTPKQADEYNKRFKGKDIAFMVRAKCSPQESEKFNKRFDGHEISKIVRKNISPEEANLYDKRFHGEYISWLADINLKAEKANKYNKRFDGHSVFFLGKVNILPKEANSYWNKFSYDHIITLNKIGIKSTEASEKSNQKLLEILQKITKTEEIYDNPNNFKFLGLGQNSIVLQNKEKKSSYKCSQNLTNEKEFIKIIDKNKIKNIVQIMKVISQEIIDILELEYISGDSLENILKEKNLSTQKVLQYGFDIMNGLIEMRRAGIIYHRDIRPANIMIDEENDKAVIIDLGIATTNRHAKPQDNRRYGGTNDLTSLAQVMYKMATGKHLFAKSKSMETTIQADELQDHREWIYQDKKRIQHYLKKVDKNIENKEVSYIIKHCLTAKNHEYKKTWNMMKEYRK